MNKEDYIKMGVNPDKIHISVVPSICTWSVSRKCLVGNTKQGPPKEEVVTRSDGSMEMTYENNRIVSMQNHITIDVNKINDSAGIIIPENNTDGYFRYGLIPTE